MFPRTMTRCARVSRTMLPFLELSRRSSTQAVVDIRSSANFIESVKYYQLQYYADKKETGVSLEDHTRQAELIQVAAFLHRELPVRLANRARELESNDLFKRSKSIMSVVQWYKQSFRAILKTPAPINTTTEAGFASVIQHLSQSNTSHMITMARGAHELRTMLQQDTVGFAGHRDVHRLLDEFYLSRIDIRTLIGQYLSLRKPSKEPHTIGLVNTRASPYDIAHEAIAEASELCTRAHGDAPEVTIHGRTDLTFPYISAHISYIMQELLKNSMRATVETHGVDNMPPIRIIISDGEGNEDVVIKISDEGGGIKRSNMNRIWSYLYTTADPEVLQRMLDREEGSNDASPLAGLGYGLPLAKNYARYFGGELTIMSMEGYGTDSFIHLPRLSNQKIAATTTTTTTK